MCPADGAVFGIPPSRNHQKYAPLSFFTSNTANNEVLPPGAVRHHRSASITSSSAVQSFQYTTRLTYSAPGRHLGAQMDADKPHHIRLRRRPPARL